MLSTIIGVNVFKVPCDQNISNLSGNIMTSDDCFVTLNDSDAGVKVSIGVMNDTKRIAQNHLKRIFYQEQGPEVLYDGNLSPQKLLS